jgi:hypothetical protein
VTSQGVVGGVLSELGVHGAHGGIMGGRGVAGSSHCEVGASEGVRRDGVHPLGVGDSVGGRSKGEGGVLAGWQPRAPPLPRVQLKNDKQKFFPRSPRL